MKTECVVFDVEEFDRWTGREIGNPENVVVIIPRAILSEEFQKDDFENTPIFNVGTIGDNDNGRVFQLQAMDAEFADVDAPPTFFKYRANNTEGK